MGDGRAICSRTSEDSDRSPTGGMREIILRCGNAPLCGVVYVTMTTPRILAAPLAVFLAASSAAQLPSPQLDVRFAPSASIYIAQENRNFALGSIEIQNAAIVNTGSTAVTVGEVLIDMLVGGEVFRSERLSGRLLAQRWNRLKAYLDTPGVLASEEPRYRFKELLGSQITLSSSTTLAPGTAMYVARRYFVDAIVETVDGKPRPIFPDRVRVSVTATSAAGERVQGINEMRIVSYQPRNDYHFPVEGRWYINASSSIRSHHRSMPVHEFALDLVQIGDGGRSFRGKGTSHADYFAFGKDILAIGDGIVTAVYDGVPETRLRRPDETADAYRLAVFEPLAARGTYGTGGNQITIEHPGGEFSTYAHLRDGGIRVKKGDRVRRGQPIAQVGMSGDGYQPHLHVQLTDGPDGNDARGIPLIFTNVRPVLFSSTLDLDGRRQLQAGEFVDTVK
jgi:murein DD-endopeptidase MepM/ murein hydrolase activator NlpD